MATGLSNETMPLVVIVGPTASGKTALAIKLASQFDGEIICADSRTVYKGMDVGTAKPTIDEQAMVPHWGIDLVEPGDYFSVSDFKDYAVKKVADIRSRGKVPFIVGGTGLYVDAVVFDYDLGPRADEPRRAELEELSVEQLQSRCIKDNIDMPADSSNRRRLIRAIELESISVKRSDLPLDNAIIVGITTPKHELRTRIESRSEQFFLDSVVKEATLLGEKHGWDSEAMTGNIYPLIRQMLSGEISEQVLRQKFATSDWRLAKRQMTWLRRNEYINWANLEAAEHYLSSLLAAKHSL